MIAPECNSIQADAFLESVIETYQSLPTGETVQPLQNYQILYADRGRYRGIRTDETLKRQQSISLQTLLETGSVYIHEKAFTRNEGGWPAVKSMIFRQLQNFMQIYDFKRGNGRPKYSGKDKGPDDLVMTLLLALFGRDHFRANFSRYHPHLTDQIISSINLRI